MEINTFICNILTFVVSTVAKNLLILVQCNPLYLSILIYVRTSNERLARGIALNAKISDPFLFIWANYFSIFHVNLFFNLLLSSCFPQSRVWF